MTGTKSKTEACHVRRKGILGTYSNAHRVHDRLRSDRWPRLTVHEGRLAIVATSRSQRARATGAGTTATSDRTDVRSTNRIGTCCAHLCVRLCHLRGVVCNDAISSHRDVLPMQLFRLPCRNWNSSVGPPPLGLPELWPNPSIERTSTGKAREPLQVHAPSRGPRRFRPAHVKR
jgi:hypothetical protein